MGCIVEPIRYPYRTTMRFYTDSGVETPVCWYFCSPEAKPLGCYTRFGSGLYGKDYMDKWEGVGEVAFGPLDFRPECCQYPGKGRVGTAEQFAEGVSLADAPPPVRGLFLCSSPALTKINVPWPRWLDFADQHPQDQSQNGDWAEYAPFGPGYIAPYVSVTISGSFLPSLNHSFTCTWRNHFPDSVMYATDGANAESVCEANPAYVTVKVYHVSADGSYVDVQFSGTEFPDCEIVRLHGTPRPANYSGSGFVTVLGTVSITITELTPFIPPPGSP